MQIYCKLRILFILSVSYFFPGTPCIVDTMSCGNHQYCQADPNNKPNGRCVCSTDSDYSITTKQCIPVNKTETSTVPVFPYPGMFSHHISQGNSKLEENSVMLRSTILCSMLLFDVFEYIVREWCNSVIRNIVMAQLAGMVIFMY